MSCENDKNFHEEYEEYNEEGEEEDKKCPAKLHFSWSNPNEGHKPGNDTLVYKEEGEDTKCPPQHVHEYVNQPSMESSNHEKAHREFARKDKETIEMEEGVFCAEWETFNKAAYGQGPGSNPNERGLSIEATKVAHGTSCGRHAVPSSKGPGPDDSPGPGPDTSPGAKAVDCRAHLPNNAHRRTHAFPPTRPGAERVPGPDCKRLDEDEDQMTIVSHEESILPVVPEAERVNTEEDERRRQAEINQAMNDFIATTPVADVVPDNYGRRQKLVGAILLVIVIATVIGVVLGIKLPRPEPVSPPDYNASLSRVSSDKGEALRNPSTPQYKAFNWVVTNNTHLAASSIELIIQRYALATFFYSTNGNSWNDNTGWLSEGKECLWHGLKCTTCTPSDEVYELDLVAKKDGEFAGNNLGGTIPPEIGLLSALGLLSLWNNTLEGAIPSEVGQLTKLASLDLSWNALTGTLPSEIGMLSDSLASLDLSWNVLTGTLLSEIGELTKLTALWLYDNALGGTIPKEIGELTKLTALALVNNTLTGAIPSVIGLLTNLEGLWLYNNALRGTIPTEIGELTKLTALLLYNNALDGTIPTEIGELTKLTDLELDYNALSGTIPPSIGTFTDLDFLDFGDNNLSGQIPTELGLLTKLTVLSLGSNGFTGTIPSELGLLTKLTWLTLSSNKFIGTVPTTLASLTFLDELILHDNDLTGSLDAFCGIELEVFVANTCRQADEMNCTCCTHCCDLEGNCELI